MNTKLVMISSALVMAVCGIFLSFFPEEILNYMGAGSTKLPQVFLQILGALYLGFAMLNWMAKANLIGGIYSRPVAIGNLMHFLVGALALIKVFFVNTDLKIILIPTIIYLLFSLLFATIVFGSPKKAAAN